MRNLERQLGTIARKVAARVATTVADAASLAPDQVVATVDEGDLQPYLGPPRFRRDVQFRTSRPGVATGVAWTESGGDVLFIEASLLPSGHGQITLTGHLGNVMQESARAAVSHLRSAAAELGLPADLFKKHDLHVHVPAGAIPKDGPSAGVTMATAILSAIRKQPVRSDVAMTGEITLSGAVLPGRRHPREGAGRPPLRHHDVRAARAQRRRHPRAARGSARGHDVRARQDDRRGAGAGASAVRGAASPAADAAPAAAAAGAPSRPAPASTSRRPVAVRDPGAAQS